VIKKILNRVWGTDDQQELETPSNVHIRFLLSYDDIFIGTLELEKGVWSFSYSPSFPSQNIIPPLVDFSDVTRKYETRTLWPFFVSRIPGLNQPKVKEILAKENISSKNYVELLTRFGKDTITNPYTLKPIMLS
jgi:HipA-like protein